ncbi:MAG TPA: CHRD domain-containing protein [Planctomycetota bacterium]
MLYRRAPLLLLAALALPACHDDDDGSGGGSGGGGSGGARADGTLAAALSGNQEAPPVLTFAEGAASFFIPANRDRLQFTVSTFNLTGITMAHIHLGPIGVDGPIIFDLATAPFVGTVQGTLTAANLRPTTGASTFEEALNAVLSGAAYVNVHTLAFPDGEIRGQIGPATFRASLDGTRMLPAVSTTGTGVAGVALNIDQTQMSFTLDVAGLSGPPTAARIHVAPAGLNGPPIFNLSTTMFDTRVAGTLSAADLQPQLTVDVITFPDAVDALLSGNAYVLVTTAAFPGGEIRGQLLPGPLPPPPAPVVPPAPPLTEPTPAPVPTPVPAPIPVVPVIPPVGAPLVLPIMMVQPGLPPVSSPSVPPSSNLTVPPTTPVFAPVTNPALPPVSSPSVPPSSNVTVPATTPVFGPVTNPTFPPFTAPTTVPPTSTVPTTTPTFGPATNFTVPP